MTAGTSTLPLPPAPGAGSREVASALLWTTQPVAIAMAANSVPPLLQATVATSSALLLLWLWTRWHNVPVLAQDDSLGPGTLLGLLFSARLGLLYLAISEISAPLAMVLTFGALVALHAGRALVQRGRVGASLAAIVLAAAAVLLGLLLANGWGAFWALAAGLLWSREALLARHPHLAHCGGEKIMFYQLIGAAVTLPVASVVAGDNWLLEPSRAGLVSLGVQILVGGLALPLLWFAPGAAQRPRPLAALALVAPLATLALQTWIVGWPGPLVGAACLLLTAAAWLTTRRG